LLHNDASRCGLIRFLRDAFEAAVSNFLEGDCIPSLGTDALIGRFLLGSMYCTIVQARVLCAVTEGSSAKDP
jgi:hypothetical protein